MSPKALGLLLKQLAVRSKTNDKRSKDSLMTSALVAANEILPKNGYLKSAEEFFLKI